MPQENRPTSNLIDHSLMSKDAPPGVSFRFLGEGNLGSLIRAKDWSQTSVGALETWPTSLKSYVSMILTLPTPAIIFWGEDQVQIYNDGYSVIMGPRHPKYLGASYRECWPDTYPTIYPWMQRVLKNGEVVEVDRTLIPVTRHGFNEEAFFSFTFSPLRDDFGSIGGFLQIVTEMTEAVLAQRRLAILQSLTPSYGSESLNVQKNAIKVLAGNPSDVRFALLFLPREEAGLKLKLSQSFGAENQTLDQADSNAFSRLVQQVFTSGTSVEIDEVQRFLPHTPIAPWPEPTQKALALPLRRSEVEAPRGVIVLGISPRLKFDRTYQGFFENIAREIAVALAAEQERATLERANQELHQFFMQAPAPMVVLLGPAHRFALANPHYERFVGGRKVTGKTVLEAFTREEVGFFVDRLDEVYQTGKPYIGQKLPLSLPDEKGVMQNRFINVGYHPFRDPEGMIKGVLAIHQDVTEQVIARRKMEKLAENLQEAVRARDEFVSIASHELKTPLSSLKLQSQITKRNLVKGDPSALSAEKVTRFVDQTNKQVSKLVRLVDDMLDVSRIQTGKLTIQPERFDFAELLREVLEKLRNQMIGAGTPLTFEQPNQEKIEGVWDRMRLEQVMTNLLTNAIRYGNRKPVTVRLQRNGNQVLLMLQDQGIGISKEAQAKIFNRFERAVRASEVSGLGLGLFITHQIVKSHGGRIWVESEVGKGSVFFVELPIEPQESKFAPECERSGEEKCTV